MKTAMDLKKLKNQPCPPFENAYVCLIASLEKAYLGKLDGKDRVEQELAKWDNEAKKLIIQNLIASLSKEVPYFDSTDLLNLL